jgi:hypothetical protein
MPLHPPSHRDLLITFGMMALLCVAGSAAIAFIFWLGVQLAL